MVERLVHLKSATLTENVSLNLTNRLPSTSKRLRLSPMFCQHLHSSWILKFVIVQSVLFLIIGHIPVKYPREINSLLEIFFGFDKCKSVLCDHGNEFLHHQVFVSIFTWQAITGKFSMGRLFGSDAEIT